MHRLFTYLKKCRFYKNKICFLNYIILAKKIEIKDIKIKIVTNWPKLILLRYI